METAPRLEDVATKPASQLPWQVVTALDSADPAALRSLLTTLAYSLESPATVGARRRAPLQQPPRRVFDQQTVVEGTAAKPSRRVGSRRLLGPIAMHVLLPMTVVTSALVLLMAWVR
ncbi:MAG: hypothetical protein ACXWBO_17200 [Ilumatobacteraceae bacterium]